MKKSIIMFKEYYFISDLHLRSKPTNSFVSLELINFLKKIETKSNVELIIVGDFLEFWDQETTDTNNKLLSIIKSNIKIFNQFKLTGKKITITYLLGNHDYALFFDSKAKSTLKKYNINLVQDQNLIREINNKKIWIEHGHQHDEYNKIKDFSNPTYKPFSYYVVKNIVSKVKETDSNPKHNWLNDIFSVQPRDYVANWIFSNYFYRELNPVLKYVLLPFLLLFSFSFLVLIAGILKKLNLINISFFTQKFSESIGVFGNVLDVIILFDTLLITLLLLIAFPLYLVYKDVAKTMQQFGLKLSNLKAVDLKNYITAAEKVFSKDEKISFFVFGHNHEAMLKNINNKVILNTGTWTKILTKVIPLKIFILPSVYYQNYQLTYGHIYFDEKNNSLVSELISIPKSIHTDLTRLQKIATIFKVKHRHLKFKKIKINLQ